MKNNLVGKFVKLSLGKISHWITCTWVLSDGKTAFGTGLGKLGDFAFSTDDILEVRNDESILKRFHGHDIHVWLISSGEFVISFPNEDEHGYTNSYNICNVIYGFGTDNIIYNNPIGLGYLYQLDNSVLIGTLTSETFTKANVKNLIDKFKEKHSDDTLNDIVNQYEEVKFDLSNSSEIDVHFGCEKYYK